MALGFISFMELIGTGAFAMAGALVAIEKELDYYGIAVFAMITAVGGGIIRDVLIDKPLPAALENPLYVLISIGSAALVILLYKRIVRYQNVIQVFDAVGLAAFTAIGCEVAVKNGLDMPFVIITLALLTGTGGGTLRDVFAREIPFVFRKEVYAVASIVGAACFILVERFFFTWIAMYVCFGITLLLRLVSMKMNLHLKKVKKI